MLNDDDDDDDDDNDDDDYDDDDNDDDDYEDDNDDEMWYAQCGELVEFGRVSKIRPYYLSISDQYQRRRIIKYKFLLVK